MALAMGFIKTLRKRYFKATILTIHHIRFLDIDWLYTRLALPAVETVAAPTDGANESGKNSFANRRKLIEMKAIENSRENLEQNQTTI